MTRMMLTGIATVFALSLLSAVVMIANAPASTRADTGNPFEIGAAETTNVNTVGTLVVTFEPTGETVDRD